MNHNKNMQKSTCIAHANFSITLSKQPGTQFTGMEYYIGYTTYFKHRWSTNIFISIESGWGKSLLASLGPSWSNIEYPKIFSHFLAPN